MSTYDYQITKTNGTVLTFQGAPVVVPALGNINGLSSSSPSSLDLIGKGSTDIAVPISNSLIRLLENFANSTAPNNPQAGQLWFNSATQTLNLWTGSAWQGIGSTATSLNHSINLGVSGDASGSVQTTFASDATIPLTLASVNTNIGSFTGANITVDAKGRVTAASSGNFAPLNSPIFTGNPQGPTPANGDNSSSLATTAWVNQNAASLNGFAPIDSPHFTGDPTAPTCGDGDNSTNIATTAFVQSTVSQAVAGKNVDLSGYAKINSPDFTGTPQAPTPGNGDNSQNIATTAFVQSALGSENPQNFVTQSQLSSATGSIPQVASSLGQNGWAWRSDGFFEQWGFMSGNFGQVAVTVPFNVAFDNCFGVYFQQQDSGAGVSSWLNLESFTNNQAVMYVKRGSGDNNNVTGFWWRAIGQKNSHP